MYVYIYNTTSYGHEGFSFDRHKCLGTVVQDLPRHRHSDPRLSVSFQSQTRWMAGEWKSWLKPNPNTFASFHPVGQKGRKGDRHSRPALLRSRIIPFRVFCALKYKYDGGKEIFFLFFPSLPFLIHLEIFFFLWNWKVSDFDNTKTKDSIFEVMHLLVAAAILNIILQ